MQSANLTRFELYPEDRSLSKLQPHSLVIAFKAGPFIVTVLVRPGSILTLILDHEQLTIVPLDDAVVLLFDLL
jgi:hypothetical protein